MRKHSEIDPRELGLGDGPTQYSFKKSGERTGIDLDLSRSLGRFLGVSVAYVPTTWPTLMADLAEDRFDLAMSGISRTPEREARAFFSKPYALSGKTPIIRCADRDRLDTWEKIDQPATRVITNPGGSNERFARTHLKAAAIAVFPDNSKIFEQIAAGNADVMVTDSEEVKVATREHPSLCPAMPGKELEPVEKAVLMPKNAELRDAVDRWLDGEKESGELKRVFEKYLPN